MRHPVLLCVALLALIPVVDACSRSDEGGRTTATSGESPAAEISDAEASSLQAEAEASLKGSSLFSSTAATQDDGEPGTLRAGLWEVTYKRDEMGFSETRHICVDAKLAATLAEKPASQDAVTCSRHQLKRDGDDIHVDTVCTHNDTTLTSHIDITLDGGDAFHQEMETVYDPAFAGHGDTHMTADGKRIGDCPAGMAPGRTTVVAKS